MRKIVSLMLALLCLTATAQTVTLTATKYHPGVGGVGHRTADGSYIDKKKLANGEIRWVAFSLDMFSQYGYRLGDTIVVRCDKVPEVNGEWVVRDKMGRHLRKRMDFLLPHRGSNYFHGHVTVEVSKKKASKKGAAAAGDVANPTAATSKVRSVHSNISSLHTEKMSKRLRPSGSLFFYSPIFDIIYVTVGIANGGTRCLGNSGQVHIRRRR